MYIQARRQMKRRKKIMVYNRRRGTAIVETDDGILVVCNSWDASSSSEDQDLFTLPGGKAHGNENRRSAAIRELLEETGLKALESTYLFYHKSRIHKNKGRKPYRDSHKVFLVKTEGIPKPQKEVKRIAFFKSGSNLKLSHSTREIIEMFLSMKGSGFKAIKCEECGGTFNPNTYPLKCPYCGRYQQKTS
jgi:ADP-ribose pyrophosphatase YjhB (NUDIX family)